MGARSSAPRGESAPHLREGMMRMKNVLMSAGLALALLQAGFLPAPAQAPAPLSGQVSSAEEGAMEGVLVSARKAGSNITVTVVSDAQLVVPDCKMIDFHSSDAQNDSQHFQVVHF